MHLLAAVLFIPGLHNLFEVMPLNVAQYASVLGLAVAPTIVIQMGKIVLARRKTIC